MSNHQNRGAFSKPELKAFKAAKILARIQRDQALSVEAREKLRALKRKGAISMAYSRVSGGEQNRGASRIGASGLGADSLNMQVRAMVATYKADCALAAVDGRELPPWIGHLTEEHSAFRKKDTYILNRPEGKKLEDMLTPGSHIYFYAVDRLSRDVGDAAKTVQAWMKRGITLHFIQERIDVSEPMGWIHFLEEMVAAERYSVRLSMRLRALNADRRARGLPTTAAKANFFYKRGSHGELIFREERWPWVLKIAALKEQHKDDNTISDTLEREIAANEGRPMRNRTIKNTPEAGNERSRLPARDWTKSRCAHAYKFYLAGLAIKKEEAAEAAANESPEERATRIFHPAITPGFHASIIDPVDGNVIEESEVGPF